MKKLLLVAVIMIGVAGFTQAQTHPTKKTSTTTTTKTETKRDSVGGATSSVAKHHKKSAHKKS